MREELARKGRNTFDESDDNISELEEGSVEKNEKLNLVPDSSLPLPEHPNTRSNQREDISDKNVEHSVVTEMSFILTPSEWKAAFSSTQEKLNDGWTNIFSNKLIACGITCSLRFGNRHIREGQRKSSCSYFWFCAACTNSSCTRSYRAILQNKVEINTSPIFRLRIFGEENHDGSVETMSRQLRGEERLRVGMILIFTLEVYIVVQHSL